MRVKTLGIAALALTTLMTTSSLALARNGDGKGPGAGYGCAGMVQLTPEQQAAFQKLHDAYATKTAQLRADLGVKMAELNAATVAANPDQGKIDALTKQIGEMEGKLLSERALFRQQVAKEVGPAAAAGMGGYHHRGMGGGMGMGMGGGMGMGTGPCGQ